MQSLDPLELVAGFQGTKSGIASLQNLSAAEASVPPGNTSNARDPVLVNQPEPVWVLGTSFLKRFVTILDFGLNKVGFAEPVDLKPMPDSRGKDVVNGESDATFGTVQALVEEKVLLEQKMAQLRGQLQMPKHSGVLQDMAMKSKIQHLEEQNAQLRVNCTLIKRRIAEGRLHRAEEKRRAEVRGGLERERSELTSQLSIVEREKERSDAAQLTRWAGMREQLAALREQQHDLLQLAEDLREEHLDLKSRDRMLLIGIVAVLGVAATVGLSVVSCVYPRSADPCCGAPGTRKLAFRRELTRPLPLQGDAATPAEAADLEVATLDAE